jgi:UDP-N-acetylmuramate dehydrogenase
MRPNDRHITEIGGLISGRAQRDVALSRYTSFKIGGPADLVVEPADVREMKALLEYLRENHIDFVLLGAGTNVLFHDEGFSGVVVRTGGLGGLSMESNGTDHGRISAQAGVGLPVVLGKAARQGWSGLESLWGIPGSFGGAVVMNAGAGGVSLGDRLRKLTILTEAGNEVILGRDDLRYGYRSLDLPQGSVVVEAVVRLDKSDIPLVELRVEEARSRRRSSQPLGKASAGCVFRNPSPERPAGAVIDRLGFKGTAVGGAQVSLVHANFIVNTGGAKASDVLALIEKIRERVKAAEDLDLELEIKVIGRGRIDV